MKNLINHPFKALFASVFIAFCWLGNALQAQNATVTKIRATYNEIQEKITECTNAEEPEVCRLYLNTLNVNQKHSPWAAVGNYGATRDFWFERGSGEGENGPRYVLRKINIQTSRSAHQESEEYLFDADGKLLFYFFKDLSLENDLGFECRFYFKGDQLAEYTEKVNAQDAEYQQYHKGDAALVLRQAEKMVAFFQGSL